MQHTAVFGLSHPSGQLPGESAEGYRPIQDRLAWVVVYTHPEPFDARISGERLGSTAPPIMMSRSNFIIDAQTGEFLGGFFTK